MFWISIVLAICIGVFALFNGPAGIGSPLAALILAGNAFVRLHRGQPPGNRQRRLAAWSALAVSVLAFGVGLYHALVAPAA